MLKSQPLLFQQIITVDSKGWLAIYSIPRQGALLLSKRLLSQPVLFLADVTLGPTPLSAASQQLLIVAADRAHLWHLVRDVGYNVLRQGHTGAVVAVHTCDPPVGTRGNLVSGTPGLFGFEMKRMQS